MRELNQRPLDQCVRAMQSEKERARRIVSRREAVSDGKRGFMRREGELKAESSLANSPVREAARWSVESCTKQPNGRHFFKAGQAAERSQVGN